MSRDGASERGPRQHTPSSPPLPYADVIATGRRVSMLSAPQTGALRVRGRGRRRPQTLPCEQSLQLGAQ
jgi:hypothetical protein